MSLLRSRLGEVPLETAASIEKANDTGQLDRVLDAASIEDVGIV